MATKLGRTRQSVLDRFFAQTIPEPNSGCLLWTGTVDSWGYGAFTLSAGIGERTNRMAWQIANGPIPAGLHVLHRCDVPSCVNPDHLWLGTDTDNVRDKYAKGRDWQSKRTHCPSGHPYDDVNTRRFGTRRGCLTCHRERESQRRASRRVA